MRHTRLASILLLAAAAPAAARTTAPDDRPAPPIDPVPVVATPLLREGSRLVDLRATVRRDEASGWWELVPEDDPHGRVLTLLPCTLLGEMQRGATGVPDGDAVFEVTGEIFAYRGMNYFLPTHAPRIVALEPPAGREPAPEDEAGEEPAPATRPARPRSLAEDILRGLEDDAPVARPPAPYADDVPRHQALEASADHLVREGELLVDRRGTVLRDERGAWLLVFDADAQGLADPPMTLMPCLLLERLERYAYRGGEQTPVLVTGRVHVYGPSNYLLPTSFRVPTTRTPLTP